MQNAKAELTKNSARYISAKFFKLKYIFAIGYVSFIKF